ncbi:MAG: hypothetical protein GY903_31710 [Fuerstiella sp.]|nr:hypothetical protein [Fuerstiella sp.]MCP4859059.1 hypothetical protein [Fuerstiella sp.]
MQRFLQTSLVVLCSISAVSSGVGSGADLDGASGSLPDIIFAVRPFGVDPHYYANFGYYCSDPDQKVYAPGGQLCRLNSQTGEVTVLLDAADGGVRDPQMHYTGRKLLFSYRKPQTEHYHLCEINIDGTELRQLTDGPFDDIEPTYLPSGKIVFCSSRCNRWVGCWKVPVANLHQCEADGSNIKSISSNAETENTPVVLHDGRVLYTRWEYVERSQLCYHHLWTTNADGTGQMTFFGNMFPTGLNYALSKQDGNQVEYSNVGGAVAMLDSQPIPGSAEIVSIFSPGHGRKGHQGYVTIVDPQSGPDSAPAAKKIHADANWRDPHPVSGDVFLVARGRELHLMDRQGQTKRLHGLSHPGPEMMLHEPILVRSRKREQRITPRTDDAKRTGHLILANVAHGRNMEGVEPGDVRKLLILEQLPAPFHLSPGFDGISLWGTFTLTRIMGTVPVEADGSAYLEVPAKRSLFFVALDKDDLAVKKMQSFVTVQPGEVTSCIGCHEHRTAAPSNPSHGTLLCLQREPSVINPVPDTPEIIDFRRHIQPILDQHCIECHGNDAPDGGISLAGGRGVDSHGRGQVLHSYVALVNRLGEIADGRNAHGNRAPRTMGSSASKLMTRIDGSHYDVRVSAQERRIVQLWLDSGAAANGTYAIMDGGTAERPSPHYIREMKRYGILPAAFSIETDTIDAYETDEAYWRSFWIGHAEDSPP